MHVEADLLDSIRDVRPGEGQVLESPARLRYAAGSAIEGPSEAETLAQVSTEVEQGLQ